MEARLTEKKPTRSERVKKCGIETIDERYLDQGLTFDIMEEAGEVNGLILDLAAVKRWQLAKIAEARKQNPPPTDEEIHKLSQINPFTKTPFDSYVFLKELDQEIENWLLGKEAELKLKLEKEETERKEAEKKQKEIERLETYINKMQQTLNALLSSECTLLETQKTTEIDELLKTIDTYQKTKSKLSLGIQYYNSPETLSYEITRLEKKKEAAAAAEKEIRDLYFSKADQDELELCYKLLDSPDRDKIPGLKYYRLSIFQHAINLPATSSDLPVMSIPKLNKQLDEQ